MHLREARRAEQGSVSVQGSPESRGFQPSPTSYFLSIVIFNIPQTCDVVSEWLNCPFKN